MKMGNEKIFERMTLDYALFALDLGVSFWAYLDYLRNISYPNIIFISYYLGGHGPLLLVGANDLAALRS